MEKLNINYPIIVEGRYDKIKILSVANAYVLTTDGFGIFKNNEKMAVIRKLASVGKIIVMTDSDGAGKLIRSHITSCVSKDKLIQLYTPQIKGKERRKEHSSAEGFLGVEGADALLIYDLLLPFSSDTSPRIGCGLTKADLYSDGLTGQDNSKEMRNLVLKQLSLPKDMTPNAMLSALNAAYSIKEYKDALSRARKEYIK